MGQGTIATEITNITNAISALNTQTAIADTGKNNTNLATILATSVLPQLGYTMTATTDASNHITGYTITRDTSSNSRPQDIAEQVSTLSTAIVGSAPTWDSTNNKYSLGINLNTAMGSDYTNKLKSTNFDHNWTSGRTYEVGAVVVYNGTLLQCKTQNSDITFDASHWDTLSSGGGSSGGGGIDPSQPDDNFIDLFKGIMTGFRKALDPKYFWTLDDNIWFNTLQSDSDKATIREIAKDGLQNVDYFPYGFVSNSSDKEMDEANWSYSNWDWPYAVTSETGITPSGIGDTQSQYEKTDEQMLNSESLKIRCSILEMLTRMLKSYGDFSTGLRTVNAPGDFISYSTNPYDVNPQVSNYFDSNDPDSVLLKKYFPFVVNNLNVTDSTQEDGFYYKYNPYADLAKEILNLTQPKVITGKFRAVDWALYDEEGTPPGGHYTDLFYTCKFTPDQNNPDIAYEDIQKFKKANVVMNVRLPAPTGLSSGEIVSQNATRKQILQEYQKIMDTSLSNWTTQNVYGLDDSEYPTYDLYNDFAMPDGNLQCNDWSRVHAFISIDETVPQVDIPVQFLVFPINYDYGQMFEHYEGEPSQ